MLGLGIDMSLEFDYADQCLDHLDPTGMELGRAVSERARSGRWSMGLLCEPNGVGWCHLPDKPIGDRKPWLVWHTGWA